MPKRKGFLWEELVSLELCERAVLVALRNKRKTRYICHVRDNYKDYGRKIRDILIDGWDPDPIRMKTINEGTNHKVRHLKIPSLRDHIIHTAIVLVLEKHLKKRYYFYSCGSIPGKGQNFAYDALKAELGKKRPPKYAAEADVRKFYDSCKKEVVMDALRRIFKDKKFLEINEKVLDQMGGVLAIGFSVSHWYANLVLTRVDNAVKNKYPEIQLYRYMDNYVLLGNNKRKLHGAIDLIRDTLEDMDMNLKNDWQVFRTKDRAVSFLSYRFFRGYTLMAKPVMYRIARRLRKARHQMGVHTAKVIMAYKGILKHCNSFHFRDKYLYPNVSLRQCRRLISHDSKKRILPVPT